MISCKGCSKELSSATAFYVETIIWSPKDQKTPLQTIEKWYCEECVKGIK